MTSTVSRDRVLPPSHYRRKTTGVIYSVQNSQSVPNSARLSSTPRSSSALDRRWVHRSQGDLTLDMEVHPRLQSEFYQELYHKYPHAFRRRLESRETGRRLFNSRLHVRFKDDAEFCDENHVSSGTLENLHSNTHLTNWDREVGHYMKHKSRSRDCITSLEPSECSGSVLSVTQRLRLNSQSLNKLLNADSPLRKHVDRKNVQYDSGTENEQSLRDYMSEKSKERSRYRKKQRRVIIQRNFDKTSNVDEEINKENEYNSRRWMSKSASPTRRHLIKYSLPQTNKKLEPYHVNVESLIADSDLKIDTLFGKINTKMSGPESPPDSAIDVDTPSVQSLVATDSKGVNAGKLDRNLPSLNGQQTGSFESPLEDIESSPGSSASACASRKSARNSHDIMQNTASNVSSPLHSDDKTEELLSVEVTQVEKKQEEGIGNEEEELNKIVEKYASSENLNQNNTGAGLLQLYTEDLDYCNVEGSETTDKADEKVDDLVAKNDDDIKVDLTYSLSSACPTSHEDNTQETEIKTRSESISEVKPGLDENPDISAKEEQVTDLDEIEDQEAEIDVVPGSQDSVENVNYHADDEHEVDMVAMEMMQKNGAISKRITTHRESDVDSGIGYSSAGTDMLPPRGRASQREATKRTQPVKAKHDILPLRSEVDVDILDEVNLVHLSHDLLKSADHRSRGGHSTRDERDDTDIRLGVTKPSEKDKKLAEKYRRARSPSPYILCNRQPSPGLRPKSAPSFAQSETNLRVVDIPLTNETPTSVQNLAHNVQFNQQSRPVIKSNGTLNSKSCQNTDSISKFSSMPSLPGNQSKHSKIYSANNMSSKLIRQRQCSVTSGSSISLLSESGTDAAMLNSSANYAGAIDDYDSSPEGVNDEDYEKDIEDERLSEVELDSGTNIEEMAEKRPSELVKMIKGMYQPGVSSPRVKEKKLKIRNILKNRKGSYNPPDETGKPSDEKNIVNRIYAKVRSTLPKGTENVEKVLDDKSEHSKQKSVDVNSPDLNEGNTQEEEQSEKNSIDNTTGRKTPYESAVSVDKDTESVDQFISGASANTVTAVVLDEVENDQETVKTGDSEDKEGDKLTGKDKTCGQIEKAISPSKAQPPKKPARNKNKNKNINVLADQLNFSKYKIRVEEGLAISQEADLNTGKETDQSDQSPRSHDLPAAESFKDESPGETRMQKPTLGRGSSMETSNEIEEWQPLKSTATANENVSGKKRGSKGKFRFFKKSASMDRGIETIGMEPNPTGQNSQESKDSHSNFQKVKKPPSLKTFTSLFSRKKKKKGQFVIEDVENASKKASSLSRSEQSYALSNGKQQHYASCHSLETVDSSSQNQPIRKQSKGTVASHQEFQPVGRLLKVNPDGTQVIQLFKPENGPIGFFIAKGNAKSGNGIFVSRFVETRPQQCFAGLLGIGDEIIEVNGHPVRDFSQEAVYSLISASAVVLVKVLPFIARKDV